MQFWLVHLESEGLQEFQDRRESRVLQDQWGLKEIGLDFRMKQSHIMIMHVKSCTFMCFYMQISSF